MLKFAAILFMIAVGNYLTIEMNGFYALLGALVLYCAGALAGYEDGMKAGKRYVLTGKTK